jgi:hypothetical protein
MLKMEDSTRVSAPVGSDNISLRICTGIEGGEHGHAEMYCRYIVIV